MKKKRLTAILLALSLIFSFAAIPVYGEGDLEDQLEDVEQKAMEAEAEKQAILESIDAYELRLMELEGQVADTQEAIEAKNAEIEKIGVEIRDAKKKISDREEGLGERIRTMYKNGSVRWLDIIFESNSFSELLSNISMLQRIYRNDQETLARFEEEHAALEKILTELEQVEQDLQSAKEELTVEKEDIQVTEEALAVEVEKIQEQIEAFNVEAENLGYAIAAEQAAREAELARIREEQEAAERAAREEAERAAREEAERIAREEAERIAREEAERKAQEEAERKAQEEAERVIWEIAERMAQEENERRAAESEDGEYEAVTAEDFLDAARKEVNPDDYYEEENPDDYYEEPEEVEVEYPEGGETTSRRSEGFIWPVNGILTYPFGWRDGSSVVEGASYNHQGIDIGVDEGTPVVASQSGIVGNETGWYGGYGLAVVIFHDGGYSTVYGHNNTILVGPGDYVEQGQVIAYSGMTGVASGPHVHFEIRVGGIPTDPLGYL